MVQGSPLGAPQQEGFQAMAFDCSWQPQGIGEPPRRIGLPFCFGAKPYLHGVQAVRGLATSGACLPVLRNEFSTAVSGRHSLMRDFWKKGAIQFENLHAQPGLVNEPGGLERLTGAFLGQYAGGQTADCLKPAPEVSQSRSQWKAGFRGRGISRKIPTAGWSGRTPAVLDSNAVRSATGIPMGRLSAA